MLLTSCVKDKCEREISYETQVPVYMSWEEIRTPVEATEPRTLESMGKIYFKDSYILISEPNVGIHIVDSSNPSDPQKVSFIPIPGNKDMAVKGNFLYADSYTDLVVIDISDLTSAFEIGRMEDLYPSYSHFMGLITDPENGVVIDYNTEVITDIVDCDDYYNYYNGGGTDDFWLDSSATDAGFWEGDVNTVSGGTGTDGGSGGGTGVGGSFARFTVKGDYLYAVSDRDLITIDISTANEPDMLSSNYVGWNIETLFPYEENLFMGSQAGMFIYNVQNPDNPSFVSEFQHARACDPVAVDEDYAYVTLRDGSECEGFVNQLDVIDVTNISNPELIQSKEMHHPMGVGVDNGALFVCDDDEGLKIFNCSDPYGEIPMIAQHRDYQAFDVIPYNGMLIMIGADGLFLYNYKNANDVTLIGSILKGE